MFEGSTVPPTPLTPRACPQGQPRLPESSGTSFWLPGVWSWSQGISTALPFSAPDAWSCRGHHFQELHVQGGPGYILKGIILVSSVSWF